MCVDDRKITRPSPSDCYPAKKSWTGRTETRKPKSAKVIMEPRFDDLENPISEE